MNLKVLDNTTGDRHDFHISEWDDCTRCQIGRWAHKHVFARGTLPCDILMVGEGPGKTENLLGEPFVGRSGKLLDHWMESVQTSWTFAITNIVACRPTDRLGGSNRAPSLEEITNCSPRLEAFIAYANPKVVITLGKYAAAMVRLKLPTLHVAHPAWVLRKGGQGTGADREQIQMIKSFLQKAGHDRQGVHSSSSLHRPTGTDTYRPGGGG